MKSELSKICNLINEKISINELINSNLTSTYVSTENMLPNKGGITEPSSVPSSGNVTAYKKNDVLTSNIRPYFKKIWYAKHDGVCSNDVLVFRAKNTADANFLYYVLANDDFFVYSMATSKGTKMPRGDKASIMKYEVESFDLNTQRKIASILKPIDKKIELNNAINNNLEQQAQALVKEYCASTDFEVPLGSIMNFVNGFAFQSKAYQKSGKYRIVTIKNVQDGRIDTQGAAYIDDVPAKMKNECYLQMGDILLSLTGNVGRVGIVFENNLLLNQRVAKLTSSKDILPLLYFFFRLSETKSSLETIAKGTAQQNLSPIETLKLSLPYDEDKALILSQTLKPIFDSIVNNSVESSKLAQLRDSLLPKLMSGELDVSDIDI